MGRRDEPSDVKTEDIPKAPDDHIQTSDLHFSKAAAEAAKEDGSNDRKSATDDKKSDQESRKARRAKFRWDKLTAELKAAKADASEIKARIAELEAQVQELAEASKPKGKEPELRDFKTPQEYAQAYAKWEAGNKPAAKKKPAKKPTSEKPPPRPTAADEEIKDFVKAGKEMLGDEFQEALTVEIGVNQTMAEFMFDSEIGPAIYVHLANNPDEALKIFNASVPRATRLMKSLERKGKKGELDTDGELKFESDGKSDDPPQKRDPKNRTRAKEPPSSTRESGDNQAPPDPESESMDEYAARRKKAELRRAGFIR